MLQLSYAGMELTRAVACVSSSCPLLSAVSSSGALLDALLTATADGVGLDVGAHLEGVSCTIGYEANKWRTQRMCPNGSLGE